MPNTDSAYLSDLKTARDAILTAITAGRLTVRYKIGSREHEVEASTEALMRLDELIQTVQRRVNRQNRSPYRVASLSRPRARNSS